MKNIFIAGAARSGKSTLAEMLCRKSGRGIVSVDAFISAFQENYSQAGFYHHGADNYLIAPFIASYMAALTYNHPDFRFVLEGSQIRLSDAVKIFGNKDFDFVVLGYPQLTAEEVCRNVRKYEKPFDYTRAMTDEALFEMAAKHVARSRQLAKECQKLNLPFFDTSFNRPAILEKLSNL